VREGVLTMIGGGNNARSCPLFMKSLAKPSRVVDAWELFNEYDA
jgi:hypothetical protein